MPLVENLNQDLDSVGGQITFSVQTTNAKVIILNIGQYLKRGTYNLTFSSTPTNISYMNLLNAKNTVTDPSTIVSISNNGFSFTAYDSFCKLALVSDSGRISISGTVTLQSGSLLSSSYSPSITIPTTTINRMFNIGQTRVASSIEYTFNYPSYNWTTGAYTVGYITNPNSFAQTNLDSLSYAGKSFYFDDVSDSLWSLGGAIYNAGINTGSYDLVLKKKSFLTDALTETTYSSYPEVTNPVNILFAVQGGNVYTFGCHRENTVSDVTSDYYGNFAYKWNSSNNTWSSIKAMKNSLSMSYDNCFIFTHNNKIYIQGPRYEAISGNAPKLVDYWFGYYDPNTDDYTTLFTHIDTTKTSYDSLGNMNVRQYTHDGSYLYDSDGKKYSISSYISTGRLPAPTYTPIYWVPTNTSQKYWISYDPSSLNQYVHYLSGSNYLIRQTQAEITPPAYALFTSSNPMAL